MSGEGTITAVDAATGATLTTLPGHFQPTIAHGIVYTVGTDSQGLVTLYALKRT